MDHFSPGTNRSEVAHIGKSVVIKGEVTGSEELYIDGQVEGSIELKTSRLTIGPNGRVHARINARGLVVEGKLEGNINGGERVEMRRTAVVMGDVVTRRIVIEDGAYFKGSVDVQGEGKEGKAAQAQAATAVSASVTGHQASSESKKL
jgi:cytoskeletal protein CcmA (bactofilin family)